MFSILVDLHAIPTYIQPLRQGVNVIVIDVQLLAKNVQNVIGAHFILSFLLLFSMVSDLELNYGEKFYEN